MDRKTQHRDRDRDKDKDRDRKTHHKDRDRGRNDDGSLSELCSMINSKQYANLNWILRNRSVPDRLNLLYRSVREGKCALAKYLCEPSTNMFEIPHDVSCISDYIWLYYYLMYVEKTVDKSNRRRSSHTQKKMPQKDRSFIYKFYVSDDHDENEDTVKITRRLGLSKIDSTDHLLVHCVRYFPDWETFHWLFSHPMISTKSYTTRRAMIKVFFLLVKQTNDNDNYEALTWYITLVWKLVKPFLFLDTCLHEYSLIEEEMRKNTRYNRFFSELKEMKKMNSSIMCI